MKCGTGNNRELRKVVRSMREIAEVFGVEMRQVQRWVKKGMPRHEIGGRRNYYYDMDEVFDWVSYQESKRVVSAGRDERETALILSTKSPEMVALKDRVEDYKINRADVFAAEQMESLRIQQRIRKLKLADLSDEQLAAMADREALGWFKALGLDMAVKYDKEQLERNKGVDNINKILDVIGKAKAYLGGSGSVG